MKRTVAASLLFVFVCSAAFAAGDILQSLGVSKADASREVVTSLARGSVWFEPARRAFVKAPPAARAAMTDQVLAWTKAFVMSPEFDKVYAAVREEAKPEGPEARGSIEAELKAREAQHAAEIAEMKKSLAEVPAEYRKEAEKAIREAEAEWNRMKKDPEFQASLRQQAEGEREDEKQRYQDDLQRWNEEYPANGRKLVALRLREFLSASENVAWDAKLVKSGTKMRFADERYEAMPAEWKLCYRAGKEPVERARAFAAAWLKELK